MIAANKSAMTSEHTVSQYNRRYEVVFHFSYFDPDDRHADDRVIRGVKYTAERIMKDLEKQARKYSPEEGFTTRIEETLARHYTLYELTIKQGKEEFSYMAVISASVSEDEISPYMVDMYGQFCDFLSLVSGKNPAAAFKMLEKKPAIMKAFDDLPVSVRHAGGRMASISAGYDSPLNIHDHISNALGNIPATYFKYRKARSPSPEEEERGREGAASGGGKGRAP